MTQLCNLITVHDKDTHKYARPGLEKTKKWLDTQFVQPKVVGKMRNYFDTF